MKKRIHQLDKICLEPIGIIHSPFNDIEGMPIQTIGADGVKGTVELNEDLADGLKDLSGFSHIILIYRFHMSKGYSLHVRPFLDEVNRGVFATRSPRRPNNIGLSVVRLTGISGNILDITDVDILDGTPLMDIKPFVPLFDNRDAQRTGWFDQCAQNALKKKSDRRFIETED